MQIQGKWYQNRNPKKKPKTILHPYYISTFTWVNHHGSSDPRFQLAPVPRPSRRPNPPVAEKPPPSGDRSDSATCRAPSNRRRSRPRAGRAPPQCCRRPCEQKQGDQGDLGRSKVWLIVGTLKTSNLGLFGLGEKPVAGHLAGFFGIQKNASQVHSFAMSTASRKMSGGFLD